MPFTPFHMGPGAAIKALTGRYFSLTVFGFAQAAIDLEPLIRLIRHDQVLHGFSHTYIGALVIGILALFPGKICCQWLLQRWNALCDCNRLTSLQVNSNIGWLAAATGAFIGTYSHIFIDSIMHSDMQPFWPFTSDNGLLNAMPISEIYATCLFLGIFGLTGIIVMAKWNQRTGPKD